MGIVPIVPEKRGRKRTRARAKPSDPAGEEDEEQSQTAEEPVAEVVRKGRARSRTKAKPSDAAGEEDAEEQSQTVDEPVAEEPVDEPVTVVEAVAVGDATLVAHHEEAVVSYEYKSKAISYDEMCALPGLSGHAGAQVGDPVVWRA